MTDTTEADSDNAWSRVTAITVTYNSAAVVPGCLETVSPAGRVIVVDNASSDDTISTVAAALPMAEIIRSSTNLGFGRGNNLALERTETEFALLINPDARLRPGAIEALVRAADDYRDAAVVSPAIINPDGSRRPSHDGPYIRRREYPRNRRSEPTPEEPFCTWALSGAVMLLRMSALRDIGFFDPDIFLYFEDNDLCQRAVAAGYSLVQEPRARAEHAEGTSSRRSPRGIWIGNRSFAWARLYFIEKHWGRKAAWRECARLLPRFLLRAATRGLMLRRDPAIAATAHVAGMVGWIASHPSFHPS